MENIDKEIIRWVQVAKGDVQGHEFHGNQWTTGEAVADHISSMGDTIREALATGDASKQAEILNRAVDMAKALKVEPNVPSGEQWKMNPDGTKEVTPTYKEDHVTRTFYPNANNLGFSYTILSAAREAARGTVLTPDSRDGKQLLAALAKVENHQVVVSPTYGRVIVPKNGYTDAMNDVLKADANADRARSYAQYAERNWASEMSEAKDMKQAAGDKAKQLGMALLGLNTYGSPDISRDGDSIRERETEKATKEAADALLSGKINADTAALVAFATQRMDGSTAYDRYTKATMDVNEKSASAVNDLIEESSKAADLASEPGKEPERLKVLEGMRDRITSLVGDANKMIQDHIETERVPNGPLIGSLKGYRDSWQRYLDQTNDFIKDSKNAIATGEKPSQGRYVIFSGRQPGYGDRYMTRPPSVPYDAFYPKKSSHEMLR